MSAEKSFSTQLQLAKQSEQVALSRAFELEDRLTREAEDLKRQLAGAENEKARLQARCDELESEIRRKDDVILETAGYYISKTRAELMKEFKEGESDRWNPEEEMKAFEENYGKMSPPLAASDTEADDATSRKEGAEEEKN